MKDYLKKPKKNGYNVYKAQAKKTSFVSTKKTITHQMVFKTIAVTQAKVINSRRQNKGLELLSAISLTWFVILRNEYIRLGGDPRAFVFFMENTSDNVVKKMDDFVEKNVSFNKPKEEVSKMKNVINFTEKDVVDISSDELILIETKIKKIIGVTQKQPSDKPDTNELLDEDMISYLEEEEGLLDFDSLFDE